MCYVDIYCHSIYLKTTKLSKKNKLDIDEIVSNVMKNNAMTFFKNNFKDSV